MAALPFTTALVPMLLNSPWTEITCAYLERFDFVSHIQLANLDAPENREILQDAVEEIKSNVQREIREISTEARDLRDVSTVGRTADNTTFTTTRDVRTCVAQLARYVITKAQSAPRKFHKESADVTHRMVIISIIYEALADLDKIGGYFNDQLKPKDKASNSHQEHTHDETQREESPLFMEQDDDPRPVEQDALGGASGLFGDGDDSNSIMDAYQLQSVTVNGHEEVPQEHEVSEEARIGGGDVLEMNESAETGDHPSVQDRDQNRQMAHLTLSTSQPAAPIPQQSRKLVSRATRDYEVLMANYKALSRAHESLKHKLAKRRRAELNVCQGDCFNDLEEADHRNWEKGQEIDALKSSVAGLQSQVEVLSSKAAERDGENIQLKARIKELEKQAKKSKNVRFAAGTK